MKPRLALFIAFIGLTGWSHADAQNHVSRAVPASIPTVALDKVARHGFFFAGGKYVGELGAGKESTMGGAMYVEVMVPRQIRSPYPVVFLHGAGQTGVDWLLTPDGRVDAAHAPRVRGRNRSRFCRRYRAPFVHGFDSSAP